MIVTVGEGLCEDADMRMGQQGRGRKTPIKRGQTEKIKKGLEINSQK